MVSMDRDAYLEFDRSAQEKHELWDGEVLTKQGVNLAHARIIVNLIQALANELKGSGCIALPSTMRIRLPGGDRYVYPDASIVCGPPEVEGESDVLLNPRTIVEVLSPSTAAFQLGRKFAGYRASLSIREVLFVYPSSLRVELYTREDDVWVLRDYRDEDAVPLATLPRPLLVSRIFAGCSADGCSASSAA